MGEKTEKSSRNSPERSRTADGGHHLCQYSIGIISHSLPLQLQGRLRGGNGYDDHMANVCHKEIVNFGLDKRLFQKAKKNVMGKECLVYKGHR